MPRGSKSHKKRGSHGISKSEARRIHDGRSLIARRTDEALRATPAKDTPEGRYHWSQREVINRSDLDPIDTVKRRSPAERKKKSKK